MVKQSWRAWLAAAALLLAFTSPARATVVDFEDVTPNIFAPDEGFVSRGFNFTYVLDIGVVDSAATFLFGNAPPNADGQFAVALNHAGIAMDANGAAFRLTGLDAAFIAPLPNLGVPGESVGELHLLALTGIGLLEATLVLPAADANGDFPFASFGALDLLSVSEPLIAVGFFSCVYVDTECVFDDNLAQFAIDNIRVVLLVPESSSLAFAALALVLAGVVRRRSAR